MAVNITCIRHTHVEVPKNVCYGQTDVSLASSYHEEMAVIIQTLKGKSFDKIFSSPLLRCRRLAEELFSGKDIIFDDRLKELNFGDWEMQTWEDIFKTPEGKLWMDNYTEVPCKGGESYSLFKERVSSFLKDIKASFSEEVVLITHAGVISLLQHLVEKQTIEEVFATFKPDYGSITRFVL